MPRTGRGFIVTTGPKVEELVAPENLWGVERYGNAVFAARSDDGRFVTIVLALDEPDLVITVEGERR